MILPGSSVATSYDTRHIDIYEIGFRIDIHWIDSDYREIIQFHNITLLEMIHPSDLRPK